MAHKVDVDHLTSLLRQAREKINNGGTFEQPHVRTIRVWWETIYRGRVSFNGNGVAFVMCLQGLEENMVTEFALQPEDIAAFEHILGKGCLT